ncbi:RING/FYVE/PHD zinc finger superfamily protein [Actinidia rufa]|uniref:RING/FYVE/PHD zinc finger superfamily protein n=1 Tax=Actinidia rufa TaxID=165716 RepID=A0A7J0GVS2_9ERIC|nr:RING/FYVE/PHD zinc finger superfamily protein [Actinidia rufa]
MEIADKTLVDLELGVGGSEGSENNRGPSAAAGEIVGVSEKGRGTSATQCSVDLEGGVQERLRYIWRNLRGIAGFVI